MPNNPLEETAAQADLALSLARDRMEAEAPFEDRELDLLAAAWGAKRRAWLASQEAKERKRGG